MATPPSATSDPVKADETVPENEYDHATGMEKYVFDANREICLLLRLVLGMA